MQIINLKLADIHPYERNPRNNDAAVAAVAKSIQEFGFKNPIILDQDHVIVAGHTRYRVAKQLGMTEVPCVIADDLTPEQVKAFRIADNKTGEIAEWNYELLPVELRELQNAQFDLSLLVSRGSSGKVCAICSDTATAQTLWIEIAWGGKTVPHRSRPRPCGHRTPSTTTQPPGQKCQ